MSRRDLPPGKSKRVRVVVGCRTHDEGLAERGCACAHVRHLDNFVCAEASRQSNDGRSRHDHVALSTIHRAL